MSTGQTQWGALISKIIVEHIILCEIFQNDLENF